MTAPHVSSTHFNDICYILIKLSSFADSLIKQQRILLTPPVFCSTPKQTRRQTPNNNSHGRSTASFKQNPSIPIISQRRLQFTPNSQSFVRYSTDDSKRMNIKNIKIWLL